MEHENEANLGIFSDLLPSSVQINNYVSIVDNLLTKDNTLIISDVINGVEDDLRKKETDVHDEKYESVYNPTKVEV